MEVNCKKLADLKGHSGPVYALCVGDKPNTIFSGGADQFVARWNLQNLEQDAFAAKFPASVYSIYYHADQNLLLVGTSNGTVHFVDLESKKEIKAMLHHTGPIFQILYSQPSDCFYFSSADGSVSVVSANNLQLLHRKIISDKKIRCLAIDLRSQQLIAGDGNGVIVVMNINDLQVVQQIQAHTSSVNALCFTPDGTRLLSGGKDAHLNFWTTKNYTLEKTVPAHNFAVYSIQFNPQLSLFATASRDKTVKLWSLNQLQPLLRINKENWDGHAYSVNSILWIANENKLVSAGDDRLLKIWELTN